MFRVQDRKTHSLEPAGFDPATLAAFNPGLAGRLTERARTAGCSGCGGAAARSPPHSLAPGPATGADCGRAAEGGGPTIHGEYADIPSVDYGGSPLCDGAWGSLILDLLALLEADYNCRTLCPTGNGYLCESTWDPDTCILQYTCCSCNILQNPYGPWENPPLGMPGPVA